MKIALMVLMVGLAIPALAQEPMAAAPARAAGAPVGRTPDQVLAVYSVKLGLTEEQKTKLRPIIADRQTQMLAVRSDTTSRPMVKAKKMQALKASTDAKVNAVLTPDQQRKYAELEAEQMERAKERRAGN